MLPPADTFTWALPRRPSQPSSLWDMPASPLRPAWPPTCLRHTIHPSLPCLQPLSSRMCQGLHSYLRPYTSNTSSSSSFWKRSTAGFSRTPGRNTPACIYIQTDTENQAKHLYLIFISSLYTEEPRSASPWILTGCAQAMSTPLPSMFPSQWHSSHVTWPKAPTGESLSEINESPVETRNDPVFRSLLPSVRLSHCLAWVTVLI